MSASGVAVNREKIPKRPSWATTAPIMPAPTMMQTVRVVYPFVGFLAPVTGGLLGTSTVNVVVVGSAGGQIAYERIYWDQAWDQASVLVQLGLLDPAGEPVSR